MYYRYKTKKNRGGFFKGFLVFILVSAAAFGIFKYRNYLMFWKYSFNRLENTINSFDRTTPAAERVTRLEAILSKCEKYQKDNPVAAEPSLFLAKAHFLAGEALLDKSFGREVAENSLAAIPGKARAHFIGAIRGIRKAEALAGADSLEDEDFIILAKSSFYSGYYDSKTILSFINKVSEPEKITFADDAYFYAIALITGDRAADGVEYLKKMKFKDPYLPVILASAYAMAKQYTEAITQYKTIISSDIDEKIRMTARVNLAKVYLSQSLYREAVDTLEPYVQPIEQNPEIRAVMEKSYLGIGDSVKSKLFAPLPVQ